MSRWPGRLITKTPVTPSGFLPTSSAPGIWTLPEVAYWTKQGLWPNPGVDPYWSYVSFLLGTTATNAAQNNTFLDSSTNNFTITRNGNTTQGSFTPYGTLWSSYFDGSGDGLTAPNNAAFNLSNGDFTLECWVFNSEVTNSCGLAGVWGGGYILYREATTYRFYYSGPSGSPLTSSVAAVANAWTHLAVVRSGATLTIYVNGVSAGSTNVSTTAISFSGQPFGIGANFETGSVGYPFTGYMSNVRLVKGTALYTAAFTPPTVPLTAVSGTSILACQSNRFIDNSSNAFTITIFGNPATTAFSPFVLAPSGYNTTDNGGSGYFDGTGDYLTVPASSSWVFSGDYTLEAWVYPTISGADMQIFGTGGSGSNDQFGVTSGVGNGRVYWAYSAVGNYLTTTATIPAGAWSHIAVTRSSNTLKAFVNGAQVFSGTMSTTVGQNATNYIGRRSDAFNPFTGYMAGARIVTGTALYTAAFTPPTTPPTAVTNTSLLLNYTNAGIFDAAMQNDMETVGNAQVSTGQAKYGTTSLYIDGTGDYLLAPTSISNAFGTGDFTIECWFNRSAALNAAAIVGAWTGTTSSSTWVMTQGNSSSSNLRFGVCDGFTTTFYEPSSAVISDGTWVHLAVTRASGTLRMFADGILLASYSNSTNMQFSAPLAVGAVANGSYASNGYLDDIRVTKGYARYTGNFTPPTAALPVY